MLPQFTVNQLQSLTRPQLWELCRERGLKCYPASADCVKAILGNQPELSLREALLKDLNAAKSSSHYLISIEQNTKTLIVRDSYDAFDLSSDAENPWVVEMMASSLKQENAEIARFSNIEEALLFVKKTYVSKTCANCSLFKPFNDGTGRGLCCGSDQVARDHHPRTGDCDYMIEDAPNPTENLPEDVTKSPILEVQFIPVQGCDFEARINNAVIATISEDSWADRETWDVEVDSKIMFSGKKKAAFDYVRSNLTVNLTESPAIDSKEKDQQVVSETVQSSSIFFSPTGCVGTYEVWNGAEKSGTIKMLQDGQWLHSFAPARYGTPYEAAASLIKAVQLRQARSQEIQVLEYWGDKFVVRNNQNGHHYVVQPNHLDPKERCECGDCHFRKLKCKHQIAVEAHAQVNPLSNEIEIDAVGYDFGLLYRQWKGWQLLGTFYHALDGKWVVQPCNSDQRPRCDTADQAQLLILELAGMLNSKKECSVV